MENQPRKSDRSSSRTRRGAASASSRSRFGEGGGTGRSERQRSGDEARGERPSGRLSPLTEARRDASGARRRPEGGRSPRHNPARTEERSARGRQTNGRTNAAQRSEESRRAERPSGKPANAPSAAELLKHVRTALSSLPARASTLLASPRTRIAAAVVIILLIAWGIAAAVGSCSPAAHSDRPTSADFVSHSAPNWEDLHEEDGRMVYTVDGHVASQAGIDVSEHQGEIDWQAVAGDGIDFAIIRVGRRGAAEGEVGEDEFFAQNMAGAREAGLDVGAYFFSQAVNEQEAIEEADFVIARLKGRELAYPVVYDHEPVEGVEGRADDLSVEQMTANAKAFCDRIAAAGYPAMVYGNAADLARYSLKELSDYGIWFAEYGSTIPSRLGRFSIWQYTNEGEVAGIGRTVDLNIRFPKD